MYENRIMTRAPHCEKRVWPAASAARTGSSEVDEARMARSRGVACSSQGEVIGIEWGALSVSASSQSFVKVKHKLRISGGSRRDAGSAAWAIPRPGCECRKRLERHRRHDAAMRWGVGGEGSRRDVTELGRTQIFWAGPVEPLARTSSER